MRTFLSTILLGITLVTPAALRADDHDKHHKEKRYYDRDARDWHEWNEQEQRAYRRYFCKMIEKTPRARRMSEKEASGPH